VITDKKEDKLSLFADDILLCLKDPKDPMRKLLDLLKMFVLVCNGYIRGFIVTFPHFHIL
jgi:hypothetical protein